MVIENERWWKKWGQRCF